MMEINPTVLLCESHSPFPVSAFIFSLLLPVPGPPTSPAKESNASSFPQSATDLALLQEQRKETFAFRAS